MFTRWGKGHGDGHFGGSINTGSLIVDFDPNSLQRFPISGNYASGTQVLAIFNQVASRGVTIQWNMSLHTNDGIIQGERIRLISFSHFVGSNSHTMRITTVNNREYQFINTTTQSFWFQLGTGSRMVRLIDLPLSAGAAAPGTVFMTPDGQGNFFLRARG